jgi:HlyD family secretion protein
VFVGTVTQIRKAPQVVQNVVTYTVVVGVANPAARLVPGMTASVRFVTEQRAGVLKVPNTALRFRPPGVPGSTTPVVWVLGSDGRPAAVPVALGITDGTSTEIVRGDLEAGRAVLVGVEAGGQPPRAVPGPGFRL